MFKLFSLILLLPGAREFFGEWVSSYKKFKEFATAVDFSVSNGDVMFNAYNVRKLCELLGEEKVLGFLSAFFDPEQIRPMIEAAAEDEDAAAELAGIINNFISKGN